MRQLQVTKALMGSVLTVLLMGGPTSANETVQICMDCHGKDGVSTEVDIPTIAGMSRQYLIDSLAAYWEKSRPCPESKYRSGDKGRAPTDMCRIVKELTTQDVEQVATFYSGKHFVRAKQQADPFKAAKGKQLHTMHCENCHANGGTYAKDDAGILAGQWMEYLRVTFQDYGEGARSMPEKMRIKIDKLSPQDIEALIHYYGSQN